MEPTKLFLHDKKPSQTARVSVMDWEREADVLLTVECGCAVCTLFFTKNANTKYFFILPRTYKTHIYSVFPIPVCCF